MQGLSIHYASCGTLSGDVSLKHPRRSISQQYMSRMMGQFISNHVLLHKRFLRMYCVARKEIRYRGTPSRRLKPLIMDVKDGLRSSRANSRSLKQDGVHKPVDPGISSDRRTSLTSSLCFQEKRSQLGNKTKRNDPLYCKNLNSII